MCALLVAACSGYGKANSPSTDLAFGVDMAKRGLWNEAMFRFQAAALAEPQNAHAENNLGVAYEAQGDFDRALEHYKKALQLAPDNKEVRANYSRFVEFYQSFKNADKAKQARGFGKKGSAAPPATPGDAVPGGPQPPQPPPPSAPVGTGERATPVNPGQPPPPPGGQASLQAPSFLQGGTAATYGKETSK